MVWANTGSVIPETYFLNIRHTISTFRCVNYHLLPHLLSSRWIRYGQKQYLALVTAIMCSTESGVFLHELEKPDIYLHSYINTYVLFYSINFIYDIWNFILNLAITKYAPSNKNHNEKIQSSRTLNNLQNERN